jgi:hypothetical protein
MEPTCNIPAQNSDGAAESAISTTPIVVFDSHLVSPTYTPSVKLDALDAALAIAARNVPVIPIPYGEKGCRTKSWPTLATTDADTIRHWFDVPCNYGCAAKAEDGGVVIWDHDCADLLEKYERETGETLPPTFTVQSAGRGLPHYYFRHTAKSIALRNRKAPKMFDWQGHNKYVVGPGSVFEDREYTIIDDAPIADCPDSLVSWIEKNSVSEKPKGEGKSNPVDPRFDIDDFLNWYGLSADVRGDWYITDVCPVSGRKHAQSTETGFYFDGEHFGFHCFAANCPGSSMTIGQVVSHLAKGDGTLNNLRAPYDGPIWPNKFAESSAVSSVSETAPALAAPLRYPIEVWDGTLYGEYADINTRGNFIPREFFVEALKTVVGSILSDKLSIANVEGSNPRFYTTLIGLPSIGKDTTFKRVSDLFYIPAPVSLEEESSLNATLPAKLLWNAQDTSNFIGACKGQASSASGLAKFLPQYDRKGNLTPGQSRVLFEYGELSTLLEKIGIDGSGGALVAALCDLYDGTNFSVPAVADLKPFGGDLHLSILAGIQPERWNELGAGRGVEHSGIHSRWNLIPTEETRRVATLPVVDIADFRARLRARLPLEPLFVLAPQSVVARMGDWFQDLLKRAENSPAGASATARLNVLAWKNALHHAWIRGLQEIDGNAIEAGIALAEYQLQVREQYAPLVGDDKLSKAMEKIRRFLRKHGKATFSALGKGVNYARMGRTYLDALTTLERLGEIQISSSESKGKEVRYVG